MNSQLSSALVGTTLVVVLLFAALGLVVAILYLLSLQKCLTRVAPGNRAMNPPLVWLNLIPLFSLVWNFVTVLKVAESVVKEGQARTLDVGDGGKTLGLTYAILGVCSIIPFLGMLCALGAIVCWIMYWVKINGFSAQFAAPPATAPTPVTPAPVPPAPTA